MLFSVPLMFQLKIPALDFADDQAQQPLSKSAFKDFQKFKNKSKGI